MERALNVQIKQMAHRRGAYGFDEPVWPLLLGLVGLIFLLSAFLSFSSSGFSVVSILCLGCAILFLLSTVSYVYTTRWGKFQVWAAILLQLRLRGDEQVLDLGCGRGPSF